MALDFLKDINKRQSIQYNIYHNLVQLSNMFFSSAAFLCNGFMRKTSQYIHVDDSFQKCSFVFAHHIYPHYRFEGKFTLKRASSALRFFLRQNKRSIRL